MTVLGCLARPERVLLWCDAEVFDDAGSSLGVGSKLVLNGLGIAVCGAGSMSLFRSAARSVLASNSIDQVERRLPAELRIAAAKLAPGLTRRNPNWCSGQVALAGGFSPRSGRMLAWQFAGAALFEPSLVGTFCLPAAAELEPAIQRITGIDSIVAIARRQIDLLRRRCPVTTGKALVVIELSEHGAQCVRVPHFAPAAVPDGTAIEGGQATDPTPTPCFPVQQNDAAWDDPVAPAPAEQD